MGLNREEMRIVFDEENAELIEPILAVVNQMPREIRPEVKIKEEKDKIELRLIFKKKK